MLKKTLSLAEKNLLSKENSMRKKHIIESKLFILDYYVNLKKKGLLCLHNYVLFLGILLNKAKVWKKHNQQ